MASALASPSACLRITQRSHQRSPRQCNWSQLGCAQGQTNRRGLKWMVRGSVSEASMAKETSWVEFPKLSPAGKQLMETVAETMNRELGDMILPSQTASDVRSFQGGNGAGSVTLRAGREGSKIDFVLGSWLNCALPFGELNIATLIAMLGPEADSPHLLFEFIQSGPGSLVLVLDLLPRKDLVLEPEYLARYYENSPLETIRQSFEKHPQAQPYLTSALYVRSVVSPTAVLYKVSGEGVEGGLDGVIAELVQPAALKVVETWLDCYKNVGEDLHGDAVAAMKKRDELIKSMGVEVDLSANMPRLFGQEIADRVVEAFRKGV
ncbi:hypothetical protein KC19_8G140000 [Ceratodon purpureus]|uniref:Red chlorophyll catabolite reductase n=1 Tax=Ceratodon purpureus TaxID=3225 RepID=A0A8T0H231_CERPU|nr:hypothetical protein KC19_8G140000 [Ceratodon purpureus]